VVHNHAGPPGAAVAGITMADSQRAIFARREIRAYASSETGNWEIYVSPFRDSAVNGKYRGAAEKSPAGGAMARSCSISHRMGS